MESRFTMSREAAPRGRAEGKLLPFRAPVGGVLMHPAWRWAAASGVIVVGSCLGLVSLAPHWLFPGAAARQDRPRAKGAAGVVARSAPAPPVVSFREAPGAARYRVSVAEMRSGTLIFETECGDATLRLPAEAAARLSPGGAGELRVVALSATGQALERWRETFTLDRAALGLPGLDAREARGPDPAL